MRWFADVADVWESYRMDPKEFVDGDEVVVVVAHERASRDEGLPE